MPSLSSRALGVRTLPSPSAIVSRVSPAWTLRIPALLFAAASFLGAAPATAEPAGTGAGTEATPAATASAWDAPEPWRTDRFYVQTSVATVHFNPDDDHTNNQKLIYGEWRLQERWLEGQVLVGASAFDNSYGQPSQFVFGGLLWRPFDSVPEAYVKLAAGIVHGYKDEYQDKIPFNNSGYAPAIIPAVGYCYHRVCSEMVIFGTAGLMWTLGVTLP